MFISAIGVLIPRIGCGGRGWGGAIAIIIAVMTHFANMESEVCPPNQAEIKRCRVSSSLYHFCLQGNLFSFRILSPTLPIPNNQLVATIEVDDFSVYGMVECEINSRSSFCRERGVFEAWRHFSVTTLDGEKRSISDSRRRKKYCHVFISNR